MRCPRLCYLPSYYHRYNILTQHFTQNFVASPPRDTIYPKTISKGKSASKQEDDTAFDPLESASSPHTPHESLFESYSLTTPVLGGNSGLPPDALLQLCLQVGVFKGRGLGETKP